MDKQADIAAVATIRRLCGDAGKVTLATAMTDSGAPYASLVLAAIDDRLRPILLLSALAWHTRNLLADQRASLLVDGTGGDTEPLTGPRVTLIGTVNRTSDPMARRLFLARHPSAAGYADFTDFSFFEMAVSKAHLIEGFGRIRTVSIDDDAA